MTFQLLSIAFRHPDHPNNGAWPLAAGRGPDRKFLETPEWTQERNNPVVLAPAPMFSLQVTFSCSAQGAAQISARAVALPGNPLGDSVDFVVVFNEGVGTASVSFPNARVNVVGCHTASWSWSITAGGQMAPVRTNHRLYTLFDTPGPPWENSPHDPSAVPRLDAITKVCEWATGATSAPAVLTKIASFLFALGNKQPPQVQYAGGSDFISGDMFFLSRFLEALATDPGTGPIGVDCNVCAAALSVFANLVGARSVPIDVTYPDGHRFRSRVAYPVGNRQPGSELFPKHCIVREYESASTNVWDWCFGVGQGTINPVVAIPFGSPAPLPHHSDVVFEVDGTQFRQDRRVFRISAKQPLLPLQKLAVRYLASSTDPWAEDDSYLCGYGVQVNESWLPDWILNSSREDRPLERPWLQETKWISADGEAQLRIQLFESESRLGARWVWGYLFESGSLIESPPELLHGIGERCVLKMNQGAGVLVFRRLNITVALSSACARMVLKDVATALDARLVDCCSLNRFR